MVNNKQRLFEVMTRLDKTFKPRLDENKIYVKSSEIPSQIISWANSYIGKGFENKITVEKVMDKLMIGTPWHDADRETHQFFKLTPNGAEMVGEPVSKTGWSETNMFDLKDGTVKIPSGYVLATVGTYPKRLRLSVSSDATNFLSDNKDALSQLNDDALVALYQAKAFKPAYRQKFGDNVYQTLISLGLMNSQKAITIDGKNLINSSEAVEKLKDIENKDYEENKWNRKYKIN